MLAHRWRVGFMGYPMSKWSKLYIPSVFKSLVLTILQGVGRRGSSRKQEGPLLGSQAHACRQTLRKTDTYTRVGWNCHLASREALRVSKPRFPSERDTTRILLVICSLSFQGSPCVPGLGSTTQTEGCVASMASKEQELPLPQRSCSCLSWKGGFCARHHRPSAKFPLLSCPPSFQRPLW